MHKCKKLKLYLIEDICDEPTQTQEQKGRVVTLEPDPEPDLKPEISFHAIMGALNPKTKRVTAIMGKCVPVVLIDSRSTHNFLDVEALNKIKLPYCVEETMLVKVANKAIVDSEGKVSKIAFSIQGEEFES